MFFKRLSYTFQGRHEAVKVAQASVDDETLYCSCGKVLKCESQVMALTIYAMWHTEEYEVFNCTCGRGQAFCWTFDHERPYEIEAE